MTHCWWGPAVGTGLTSQDRGDSQQQQEQPPGRDAGHGTGRGPIPGPDHADLDRADEAGVKRTRTDTQQHTGRHPSQEVNDPLPHDQPSPCDLWAAFTTSTARVFRLGSIATVMPGDQSVPPAKGNGPDGWIPGGRGGHETRWQSTSYRLTRDTAAPGQPDEQPARSPRCG